MLLRTDASQVPVGVVLHQLVDSVEQPLSFFSRKLQSAQTRCSNFGRKLLVIYIAIKNYQHLLESRHFVVLTDHKPIVYVIRNASDRHSPKEIRQLDYISHFTVDIRHIDGHANVVADALSRSSLNQLSCPKVDLPAIAAAQSSDQELQELKAKSSLMFVQHPLHQCDGSIWCVMSTGKPRPYVPDTFRRQVFVALHSTSHPSIRSTVELVTQRFIWSSIRNDVRAWVKSRLPYKKSKIQRHTHSTPGKFHDLTARFQQVHLDIVGPLPSCEGYTHLLTCVDRFTRWPTAVPLQNTSTETAARAFFSLLIAMFGVPVTITTDRGGQFTSFMFKELQRLLGCQHITTTAYHLEANGMVERFHRQLKAALMAKQPSSWLESLSLVLLGFRNTLKEDLQCSSLEMVFGSTVRLPGEMCSTSTTVLIDIDPTSYASRFKTHMRQLEPTPTRPASRPCYIPTDLSTCTHVFVRVDANLRPLQPPYEGPFRVLDRQAKFFLSIELVHVTRSPSTASNQPMLTEVVHWTATNPRPSQRTTHPHRRATNLFHPTTTRSTRHPNRLPLWPRSRPIRPTTSLRSQRRSSLVRVRQPLGQYSGPHDQ